jgi:hypothetical protein
MDDEGGRTMPYRYFNYFGRPARLTVDDKDNPELCEVWDAKQKKLVVNNWVETDIYFDGRAEMISEEEFDALVQERLAAMAEPPVRVHDKPDDNQ